MEKLSLTEIPKDIYLFENITPVIHSKKKSMQLCTQPYYKHSKGCPNFNKKDGCPPNILHISEEYDLTSLHALVLQFPFEQYINLKKEIHPDWTNRALANQRHWQSHLRATLLNQYDSEIKEQYPNHTLILNPEGQGINVEETLKTVGIQLDWCKQNEEGEITEFPEYIYHVYFLGERYEDITLES
jgi:predicted metal-binding protein